MPANQSTPEVTRADREAAGAHLGLRQLDDGRYLYPNSRYQTRHNALSETLARHRLAHSPARGGDELRATAQFLSDRLDDLEWMDGDLESTLRDFMGHVDPAHARLKSAIASTDMAGAGEMTPEERRFANLKQMAAYGGPIVSFDVREPYYLASCDHCGWIGSSEHCGTDSFGDDSDVYCPRCQTGGADCGKVAERIASAPPVEGLTSGEGYMGAIVKGAAFLMDYGQPGVEELVRVADVQPADDVCCKVRLEGTTFWQPEFEFRRRATPLAASPKATATASVGEDDEEADRTADEAVDFVFDRLARKLGLAEWEVVEGSEEWEGDVSATLHRLLVDAGIIDDETGAIATLTDSGTAATIGQQNGGK
ncbi:hypothetical protein [Sphingomonas aquatilis]